MKVPYPTINDSLAVNSHMYICHMVNGGIYEFVKCQTLKPYMLKNNVLRHYLDEAADITRNPFSRTTRIDCDKAFITYNTIYNDKLKTTARPDVSEDVFIDMEDELQADGYLIVKVQEDELRVLNSLIQ